jgi:hypothetical protein
MKEFKTELETKVELMTLEKAIKYLKIIEDMENTNPDWYIEFRNHEDWEYGLTTTIAVLEEVFRKYFREIINGDKK